MEQKNLDMEWKDYENEVFTECSRVFRNSSIQSDVHVKGLYSKRMRQIDVLVEDEKGVIYIFDAKKYNTKIDVKDVESFIGMIKDVGADYGVIVSDKGFSKAAINRAHLGEDNIEVDILSLNDLKIFQAECAIPYAGNNGIIVNAPFGWVIDGTRREHIVATTYQKGISYEEATLNKEWAYLNFWDKDDEIDSVDDLISWQNKQLLANDKEGIIEIKDEENIKIRVFISKKYPVKEITLFRDFHDFILFVVLFSPDNFINRNIKKMQNLLLDAIPLKVKQQNIY